MVKATSPRTLAVILHADVAGSTRLVQLDELIAHQRITDTFQRLSSTVRSYGGVVHEIRGDALLAEFSRASDAVGAALRFQWANSEHNRILSDDIRPVCRIGVSLGEVIIADRTLTGSGVVIAQRLEQLADPGGVCIQSGVYEAMPHHLPFDCLSLGEKALKGLDEPVRVYAVTAKSGVELPLPEPRKQPRQALAMVAIVVAAGIGVAGWWLWSQVFSSAPERSPAVEAPRTLPDKPSIAVLPFDNLSEDQAQEYFADGLTDDLIIDLSKFSGLFVIARNSVFTFKDKPVRVKAVAADLGVHYVVEGSVRRAGDRIRVNAQLIDGTTGHHLWAERYDRQIDDLFAVQDELINQIVSALAVRLTQNEAGKLAQRPVPKLEAYELYLKGRHAYFSRDQQRMRESLDLYAKATVADPTFARAYAGLAQVATDVWRLGSLRSTISNALAREVAEEAVNKALDLDSMLPEAHAVVAFLRLVEGEHRAALDAARRAVELDPNSADAHTTLAIVLGYAGQPEAALQAVETAMRLNPHPPPYLVTYQGWAYYLAGRYAEAVAALEPIADTQYRGLAEAPREILAMAYAELGRLDEAAAQVQALRDQEIFLNLHWYPVIYSYYARSEDLLRQVESLRKAGMPEWPLGYSGDPQHRLDSAALRELTADRAWSGFDAGRELPFMQELSANGDIVYAAATTMLVGRMSILEGELCERFQGFNRGGEFCGPVFRNPSGTAAENNEYVYANPMTVKYFSPTE